MLGELRRQSKSAIIYFLFAIIIVVFVFTFNTGAGMGGGCGGTEARIFADVQGDELTYDDMVMAQRLLPTLLQSQEGMTLIMGLRVDLMAIYNADPDRMTPEQAQAIMDVLTGIHMISNEAERLGFVVDDKELAKALYPEQFFKTGTEGEDGEAEEGEEGTEPETTFDWNGYTNWVSYWLHASQPRYEDFMNRVLLCKMLISYLEGLVGVSETEAKLAAIAKNKKVDLEVAEFDAEIFQEQVQVPDDLAKTITDKKADIEAYYDSHPAEFHTPEQVKIRVALGTGLGNMPSPSEVAQNPLKDADYEKLFENAQGMLDRLDGKQPLYPPEPAKEEAKPEEAKPADAAAPEAKPEEAAKQEPPAREEPKDRGARFQELAKYWSADPGTKERGGLVPEWYSAADLERYPFGPDVAAGVAKAKAGDVIGPVRGVVGYWLVYVEEKREPRDLTLDAARKEIAGKLWKQDKGPEVAKAAAEKLRAEAGEKADKTLDELLKGREDFSKDGAVRIKKTGLFDVNRRGFSIPTVGPFEELYKDVFTGEKAVGAVGSKVFVQEPSKRIFIYRVAERQEPKEEATAEEIGKAKQELLQEKRTTMFQAWFADLKAKVQNDEDVSFTEDYDSFVTSLRVAIEQAAADKARKSK